MSPSLIKVSAALGILLVLVVAGLVISRASSRSAAGEAVVQKPSSLAEAPDGQKVVLEGLGMT